MFKGIATGGTVASAPETTEIGRALATLYHPTDHVELRVLPGGRSIVRRADDLIDLIGFVARQDDYTGIYYSLNPVRWDLDGSAKNADIVRRQWLLVDVDAVREPDTNATQQEHDAAQLLANRIIGDLLCEGWPLPLEIDSGNGWHLLYRIDLPNDELSKTLCRDALKALATRFDSDTAKVDKSVHNASRIAKLPGTWARKAADTPDRPQRLCRIVNDVGGKIVVTAEQLQKLGAVKASPPPPPPPGPTEPPTPFRGRVTNDATKISRARAYLKKIPGAISGQHGHTATFVAALKVVRGFDLTNEEAKTVLSEWNQTCQPPWSDKDLERKISEAQNAEGTRGNLFNAERNGKHEAPPQGPPYTPGESIIYRASSVTPKRVEWLWQGRIPRGKLTTFAGVGGLGKTFVLCDIAARVSRGLAWPDDAPMTEDCVGQVIFISGEDDPDDTLVPRLIQLGADLDKIIFLTTKVQDQFTLADLETLDEAIKQAGPNVQLVVIDPPTAYLGGVDDHNNAELRGLLSPLKSWSARHRVGVIFNTHVNKGGANKTEAMMRVMGSVAWVNAVRAAYMFARDPDDQDRVLFIPMKMNIARRRKGMAYRIKAETDEPDGPATVEWLGEVDTTADEAVKGDGNKSRKVVATEWLVEKFRQKNEWRSEDLFRAGRQDNISRDAIFEAKRVLNLPRAKRVVYHNGDVEYLWWVPANWPLLSQDPSTSHDSCDSCDSKDGTYY